MSRENPQETGPGAGRGGWDHRLSRLDPARRIHVGAPGVGLRTRLLDHAWVLSPDPDRSASDTRGRVIVPAGVAWQLGLDLGVVVSVSGTGVVIVRGVALFDPVGKEAAAWTG